MVELFCNSVTKGGAEHFLEILSDNFPSQIWTTLENKANFKSECKIIDLGKKISKKSYDFYNFPSYRRKISKILRNDSVLFTQFKKEQILIGHDTFKDYRRFTFEHGPLNLFLKYHPLLWYQYKSAIKCYNKRFCGSFATKLSLEKDLDLEFTHIPYGIKYQKLMPENERLSKRRELGIADSEIVITFADHPFKERGFFDLMELLKQNSYNLKFWIFGSEPTNLKFKNNVQFFGFKKNLNDYLMLSDYFINPSNAQGEAFPLRLLQAIMCGNGIISCDGLFRQEMEIESKFEFVLPRTRGDKIQKAIDESFHEINNHIHREKSCKKNNFVKKYHSVENMIQKLKNEMFL